MARFDVYRNGGAHAGAHAGEVPYLLDVQSDLLQRLQARVVVPLRRKDRFPAIPTPDRLTPLFETEGITCLMETPKLAAVPLRLLKAPVVSLADSQQAITGALDFLLQGY